MKKLTKKIKILKPPEHCKKSETCWQYNWMIYFKMEIEEIYKCCRKCIYFKPQVGGIVNDEVIADINDRWTDTPTFFGMKEWKRLVKFLKKRKAMK